MIVQGQEAKVVDAIVAHIQSKAKEANAKTLVVGLSGGIDSALVALLCKRTGLPTITVAMPCQSSPSSVRRAAELAQAQDLPFITVDLATAFETISSQLPTDLTEVFSEVPDTGRTNDTEGALRSCLRAPTLDYVGKRTQGLIVGTGNRDEDEFTRYFQKRGDGSVDFSPIAQLHKTEVRALSKFLGCTQAILDAVPSADLWGPDAGQQDEKQLGMTYDEIEWGIQELTEGQGVMNPTLTPRQKLILDTLIRMERTSRHKAEPPPVFKVREVTPEAFVRMPDPV